MAHFGLDDYKSSRPCALTLGFFDGVHRGHAALLKKLVEVAQEKNLQPLVLTFDQRPRARAFPLLTSIEERLALLESFGVDVVVQKFTYAFSHLSPKNFLRKIASERLKAKIILAGYDCLFGKNASGNITTLKENAKIFGYECLEEEPLLLEGEIVSTTLCRNMAKAGNFSRLEKFLGRPWTFTSRVEHGRAVGRILGYPTANLCPEGLVAPPFGVYLADTDYGRALLYVGTRPTFADTREIALEVFLLAKKSPNLYGKNLRVQPLLKIGEEKRYSNEEELKAAIAAFEKLAKTL